MEQVSQVDHQCQTSTHPPNQTTIQSDRGRTCQNPMNTKPMHALQCISAELYMSSGIIHT